MNKEDIFYDKLKDGIIQIANKDKKMITNNRKQKCDICGKYYLFMRLYKLENYSDYEVCYQCYKLNKNDNR